MGTFLDRYNKKQEPAAQQTPAAEPAAPQNTEIDTTDALGSLVGMLETPAEREAKERRLLEHRNKMQMWFGLFDGLRQLGNLYATAKGASPQNLTSTAPVIDQQYQQNRQLINGLGNYRNNYAQQLYNLHRQNAADKRSAEKHKAEMGWYDTRSEIAKAKADNDAIKAEAYAKAQEAKANNDQAKAAFYEAKAKALEEGDPYDIALKKAKAAQALAAANLSNTRAANVGSGGTTKTTTTGYDENGNKVVTTTTQPNGSSGSGGKEQQKKRGSLLP